MPKSQHHQKDLINFFPRMEKTAKMLKIKNLMKNQHQLMKINHHKLHRHHLHNHTLKNMNLIMNLNLVRLEVRNQGPVKDPIQVTLIMPYLAHLESLV